MQLSTVHFQLVALTTLKNLVGVSDDSDICQYRFHLGLENAWTHKVQQTQKKWIFIWFCLTLMFETILNVTL